MKEFKTAHEFYNSTEFRALRKELINTRKDKDGVLRCEHCGKPLLKDHEIIAHHKEEITAANLNNVNITLNPDNIELIHLHCHNKHHNRFGYNIKKVYIIHGSACAGKSTFVNKEKSKNDLVVDIDLIWQALNGGKKYEKPEELKAVVFNVYNELINQVAIRAGKWQTAYIISAEPRKAKRDRLAELVNAEQIYIDCDKETALKRLKADKERKHVLKQWEQYIKDYYDNVEI